MDSKGYQQKQVAQLLGVSVATVSLYLKGDYNSNVAEMDRKVDELIERDKAKWWKRNITLLLCANFGGTQRNGGVMQFAHIEGEINVILGQPAE